MRLVSQGTDKAHHVVSQARLPPRESLACLACEITDLLITVHAFRVGRDTIYGGNSTLFPGSPSFWERKFITNIWWVFTVIANIARVTTLRNIS